MAIWRFEDLRVWQAAKRQCDRVGELLKRPEFRQQAALSNQMDRASVSVMNNISEGFLRHHDPEFAQFLRIAAASNGEVRTCLYGAHGRGCLSDAEAANLVADSNAIGKMIRRLHDTLDTGNRGRPKIRSRDRPPPRTKD
jgi:four helix bundle protein